ncbi:putative fatty acid binding protein [Escherichia coli]|uniref:Putative fatty acid binding protein n=1 Tax=Escherichia coli TaxID=562 RepID=A0A376KX54_ECOLX|nr:putative fatty acid binding protein [Escherichia coli]
MEFNSSVFSPERANYYRCLQTLLLLAQEEDRQPLQYLNAFVRMYGADAVEAASAAMSGEAAFYGLQPVDSDLHAFAAHQSLLKAYEKLQRAKAAFWAKIKSNSLRNVGLMISLSYITGRFFNAPLYIYLH